MMGGDVSTYSDDSESLVDGGGEPRLSDLDDDGDEYRSMSVLCYV